MDQGTTPGEAELSPSQVVFPDPGVREIDEMYPEVFQKCCGPASAVSYFSSFCVATPITIN